ncbi:MAG: DUF998 domain-containing protein [Halieaceae bacterium]|nr:DUF998 domain-containing protein [Halieaceae bacterium]
MTEQATAERPMVSYLTLRCVVGFLGVALPVVLAIWGYWLADPNGLQDSISDYYSLGTRDLFVGTLWAIAWFLFAYKGYDDHDDRVTDLACFLALGVALAPSNGTGFVRLVHLLSAFGMFLVLAYISYFLFTRSSGERTPRKQSRDRIYRTCGIVISACIVLILLYSVLPDDNPLAKLKPVFWLEAFALWAFGVSWFVKGEAISFLNDPA